MGENGKASKIEDEIDGLSPEAKAEFIRRVQAGAIASAPTGSAIATTGGAVATGNGTAFGTVGTVIYQAQPTLPDGEPERSYLQRVFAGDGYTRERARREELVLQPN